MLENEQTSVRGATTPVDNADTRDVPQKPGKWPPPSRPRPRQRTSKPVVIVTVILAGVLMAGGLSLIIYTTTGQYALALHAQRALDTNATARADIQAQATTYKGLQATQVPLATAQAAIEATATAQDASTATVQAQGDDATATASVLNDLYTQATSGTPVANDPLVGSTPLPGDTPQAGSTTGFQWDTGSTDNGNTGCTFTDSAYEVKEALRGFLQGCFATATHFTNIAYQISLTITAGSQGGIIFRGDKENGQYYLFHIDINGNYALDLYKGGGAQTLASGFSTAISTGTGASNTLAVLANKGRLDLFAGSTFVVEVNDSTLNTGQIGVAAINTNLPTTVDFSNIEIWKLP